MLVDNIVDGDSRVQKTAMAAAAAGHDVTLIGRSPNHQRDESRLGGARLIRLPQPSVLHGTPRRAPGRSLRWPFAYPTREVAAWRGRRLQAAERNQADRQAELRRRRRAGETASAVPAFLTVRLGRLLLTVHRLWHKLRYHDYNRAAAARSRRDGLFDEVGARFWRLVLGRRCWRRLEPLLLDFDGVYRTEIDKLRPELIHAHDYRMIGIAVRARDRARAARRPCVVVYDAHEFMPGVRPLSKRWQIANMAHELQYAGRADAVVTVVPKLAEMLRDRHGLPALPTVVMNAPQIRSGSAATGVGDVRAACGLGPGVPLLLYTGAVAVQRGLATVVDALVEMADVHFALVVDPEGSHVRELVARAESIGVRDRLHLLPYVDQDAVVAFTRTADIGLVPVLHTVNTEIAIGTKYMEYAQARLPVVCSDVETQAAITRELGNGEVFVAGDVAGFVAATRAVLADPERYRSAYDRPGVLEQWTWEAQAGVLLAFYDDLLSRAG